MLLNSRMALSAHLTAVQGVPSWSWMDLACLSLNETLQKFEGAHLIPPRHGEGDRAAGRGGGGSPQRNACWGRGIRSVTASRGATSPSRGGPYTVRLAAAALQLPRRDEADRLDRRRILLQPRGDLLVFALHLGRDRGARIRPAPPRNRPSSPAWRRATARSAIRPARRTRSSRSAPVKRSVRCARSRRDRRRRRAASSAVWIARMRRRPAASGTPT